MTKLSLSTCAALCLLLSAGCTRDPKPPTPAPIAPRMQCSLVPCLLPARPALQTNDDWRQALDDTEGALQQCALQTLRCIEVQRAQP